MLKIIGRKELVITPGMKDYAESIVETLYKYFDSDIEIEVVVKCKNDIHTVELTIRAPHNTYRTTARSDDYYESLSEAVKLMKTQIIKHKEKLTDVKRKLKSLSKDEMLALDSDWYSNPEEEDFDFDKPQLELDIIKEKFYDLRPMTIDEALLQAKMLNHTFFVFLNAITDEVCVLYKRAVGYGLIHTTKNG